MDPYSLRNRLRDERFTILTPEQYLAKLRVVAAPVAGVTVTAGWPLVYSMPLRVNFMPFVGKLMSSVTLNETPPAGL